MNRSTSAVSSCCGLKSSVSFVSVCVFSYGDDLSPFLVQFMSPFAVAVDGGRCFCTCAKVMVGKPMSCSLSIALHRVSMVG